MIRYQTCTVAAVRASLPRADALHHLRIEHFLRLLELVHEAPFASVTFAAAKHHTRRFRTLSDRLYLVRERYHERERREREKREMCHHQDSSSCDVGDFFDGGPPDESEFTGKGQSACTRHQRLEPAYIFTRKQLIYSASKGPHSDGWALIFPWYPVQLYPWR